MIKILIKYFIKLNVKFWSFIYKLELKSKCKFLNVDLSMGELIIKGRPVIQVYKKSKFFIGQNCIMVSKKYFNPLGLNKKTNIRLLSGKAILQIGNNVSMSGTTICCMEKVIIGNNVQIGANCTIIDTDFHDFNIKENEIEIIPTKPVFIKDNVKIAMNVTILKGVTIGENSIIAANSLVTKSVPANCLIGGNPAKIIKYIEMSE